EVVQAAYFATSAAASAFTLASQIPNLFSNLFSQAALSAAFVPVFTELLTKGRKREAFRVASTLFWILVILVGLISLHSRFHGDNKVYAYAIAWLVATVVQFLMVAAALRRIDFRLQFSIDWHDPRVRQVFTLMLP